ncbi:hypothetical protein [Kitasatospora sp. NPDC088783]|uniref:MmyB family transcriptional regulator n=1 Tax=Kitasatospora sp. NPDC088783 TaxID=3364077 RepID=UPI00381B639E
MSDADGQLISPALRVLVGRTTAAAYICDLSWRIITFNPGFQALFGAGTIPTNIMEWMTLDPQARKLHLGRDEQEWRRYWLGPALAHLRFSAGQHPHNAALNALVRQISADPTAGAAYAEATAAYEHPDGMVRPFWHAGAGQWGDLTICASQPVGHPDVRLFMLLFDPY